MVVYPAGQTGPGCIICLLQTSGLDGARSATRRARLVTDYIIDALAQIQLAGDLGNHDMDVAVVGCRAQPGRAEVITTLLPGTTDGQVWVRLEHLVKAEVPTRTRGPRRWVWSDAGGTAPGGQTLAYVYRLIQEWLLTHPWANPPVVIRCTDLKPEETADQFVRQSLGLLCTAGGNAVFFDCIAHPDCRDTLVPFMKRETVLNLWRGLHERQSRRASAARREGSSECAADSPDGLRSQLGELCTVSKLSTAKYGNAEHECEDETAFDQARGIAAVSDGAGEGIFVKAWAALLTREFVRDQPDLGDRGNMTEWLRACREAWNAHIDYQHLGYFQRVKVDRTGGAATLLALVVQAVQPACAGGDTAAWTAWAVGDSCLFWIRDNCLLAAFPYLGSGDFGAAPFLLRTKPDLSDPVPLCARGYCRPGDLFVLATDAIAQWLFRNREEGKAIDWGRLAALKANSWEDEVNILRQNGLIVNDDCTLLFVRVT